MKQQRISDLTAILLIGVAAGFDGIKFLLDLTVFGDFVTPILSGMAIILFAVWFFFLGIRYSGKGGALKLVTGISASVIDLVPFINAVPATLFAVVVYVIQSRIEDAAKNKTGTDTKKAVALQRLARVNMFREKQAAVERAKSIPKPLLKSSYRGREEMDTPATTAPEGNTSHTPDAANTAALEEDFGLPEQKSPP